ncbi:MAG: DUF3021 domain-containing protein [Lachnospiraceae bacterium]|nr:DUF3021 domain-containing protein [Lachnospiraceae bacterium]
MNKSNGLTKLERYLLEEIGIEFKACIYFFCYLFYYSIYKLLDGNINANIIHMIEMIFLTYGMCYFQLYFMKNFDESENFKIRELLLSIMCSGIYTLVSWIGGWFDENMLATIGFFLYVVLAYICGFLVYKIRRTLESKILNEDLKAFKERGKVNE